MIIVSQKKNSITNFDNVTNIEIDKLEDDGFLIKCQIANKMHVNVGFYKTEKRAKEILQEIKYKYAEYVQLSSPRTGIEGIYAIPKIYEMPEE